MKEKNMLASQIKNFPVSIENPNCDSNAIIKNTDSLQVWIARNGDQEVISDGWHHTVPAFAKGRARFRFLKLKELIK